MRRDATSQKKKRLKNRLCRGAIKGTGLCSLKKERLGRSDNIIQQPKELPRGRGWSRFWITLRVWLGRIDRNQGQSRFQLYTVRTSELSELLERGEQRELVSSVLQDTRHAPSAVLDHAGCQTSWTSWLLDLPLTPEPMTDSDLLLTISLWGLHVSHHVNMVSELRHSTDTRHCYILKWS